MKPATPIAETDKTSIPRIAAIVRDELMQAECPEKFVDIAFAAADQATKEAVHAAEARERARIIRWLRTVADVYAARVKSADQGPETVYWFDHLEAFSQAADAISRRRHARPH